MTALIGNEISNNLLGYETIKGNEKLSEFIQFIDCKARIYSDEIHENDSQTNEYLPKIDRKENSLLDFSQFNFKKMNSFNSNNYNQVFVRPQKWIGHVVDINDLYFTAKLKDLTNKGTDEIGEFDKSEVSKEDMQLIKQGAAFYWSIGYADVNGQRERKSIIRFQRIINWTEEEYNKIIDEAEKLSNSIIWED